MSAEMPEHWIPQYEILNGKAAQNYAEAYALRYAEKVAAELAALRAAARDAEPRYTKQQIADACMFAEINDSKCESLLLALTEE